ncbi:MAG: response regulator [Firmicutes bacterium]|nr:response regulator [Bacillota bacterium]
MISVLVVDDYPALRKLLVEYLRTCPRLQVVGEAKNGLEAIEMAKSKRPQVIVMDVRMPVLDGISVTRVIKERWPEIVVISYSGDQAPEVAREAKAAGAALHLTKPLNLEELAARIQELVAVLA